MVKIRLARFGKKKKPTYRLIVADSRKDTHGRYLENVGSYNPSVSPKEIQINPERVEYWLSVGAQPSPTVHNLLVSQGIIKGEKVKASKAKQKKAEEGTENKEAKEGKGETANEINNEPTETPVATVEVGNSEDKEAKEEAKKEDLEKTE